MGDAEDDIAFALRASDVRERCSALALVAHGDMQAVHLPRGREEARVIST